jgi:hypothetical protein
MTQNLVRFFCAFLFDMKIFESAEVFEINKTIAAFSKTNKFKILKSSHTIHRKISEQK